MLRLAIPALGEEFLVLMVTWTDWMLASRYFAEDGDATKAAMGLMAYLMWLIPSFFTVVGMGATAGLRRVRWDPGRLDDSGGGLYSG